MSKLADFKSQLTQPLRQATLVFLVKDQQILLAMKKRGFGAGKWNGVGGKPEDGETIKKAAIREAKEEIGVTLKKLKQVAALNFLFTQSPPGKDWNQQVIVFLCEDWEGEPAETDEMAPQWFDQNKIPFDQMWWDDKHWLPKVLTGQSVSADFLFDGNQEILEYSIK